MQGVHIQCYLCKSPGVTDQRCPYTLNVAKLARKSPWDLEGDLGWQKLASRYFAYRLIHRAQGVCSSWATATATTSTASSYNFMQVARTCNLHATSWERTAHFRFPCDELETDSWPAWLLATSFIRLSGSLTIATHMCRPLLVGHMQRNLTPIVHRQPDTGNIWVMATASKKCKHPMISIYV